MIRTGYSVAVCVTMALGGAASTGWSQTVGHDLDVADLTDITHYGPIAGVHGYASGFKVCNIGTEDCEWVSSTNRHPVEGWALYRLADGRIEQIGISWLKHGFFAASSPGCTTTPCNLHNGTRLGVGCSDTYDSGLNSYQTSLGPRFEVNPATGAFVYPFSNPGGAQGNTVFKMAQVLDADLNPARGLYFVEGQIVHPQEAPEGHGVDTVSYRRLSMATGGAADVIGTTYRNRPAIMAWRDHGLGAGVTDSSVVLQSVDVPGDGRVWVASKATSLGQGWWHYEYAIQNLTSNRAVGSVSIPLSAGVGVRNVGFHDVRYHSGEPQGGTDWTPVRISDQIYWSCEPYAGPANELSANALRWGTLYNFRFDADVAPSAQDTNAVLGLFVPGTPATVQIRVIAPAFSACIGDFNRDGGVDGSDVSTFFDAWSSASERADVNLDGGVDGNDVEIFFVAWEQGC